MRHASRFLGIILILLSVSACKNDDARAPKGNAVYFWRTVLNLSDAERKFITDNNIGTMYVHFFDIVADNGSLRPEATLIFKDSLPSDCRIVPTVFIDSKAFARANVPENVHNLIINRVDSMMSKNGYPLADEIQIDFDWTPSNRQQYFRILDSMASVLHGRQRKISATIRLHQLSQPAPPVDYGVLMMYNVGEFSSINEQNSILSTSAVRPYLNRLSDYRLPLATALPVYDWDLLFHDSRFSVIARGLNRTDTTAFRSADGTHFVARRYMPVPGVAGAASGARILPGDVIRHEEVSASLLDSVISLVANVRPSALNRIIIYHLDENSINKYTPDEIAEIFNRK